MKHTAVFWFIKNTCTRFVRIHRLLCDNAFISILPSMFLSPTWINMVYCMCRVFQISYATCPCYVSCQVSVWLSATLLVYWIGTTCSSRVEEPVSPVRHLLFVVPRTIHPFPRCPKPARESTLSKLVVHYQCVFRRRRRTRNTNLMQENWLL